MLKAIRIAAISAALMCAVIFTVCYSLELTLPDKLFVKTGDDFTALTEYNVKIVNVNKTVAPVYNLDGNKNIREVELKLFGIFPIKTASVESISINKVVLCGTPFGLKIYTKGVIVVGMTDVDTENGLVNPAKEAGIKEGDIIISVNGVKITSNRQIAGLVEKLGGLTVDTEIIRNGTQLTVELSPAFSETAKQYKLGIWVRDSSAGIGTMTYYDPGTNIFGGLGHGICDVDTNELLPLKSGEIVPAQITSILKGTNGTPGELCGYFKDTGALGEIRVNCDKGVFGILSQSPSAGELVEIGLKQDIREGLAEVYVTVDDSGVRKFQIEIERVNYKSNSAQKNMVIKVIDGELLDLTGGIVQGMSGSPIVQNGKFIGAVTHVFVNDPTRGYAIFSENMLSASMQLQADEFSIAS